MQFNCQKIKGVYCVVTSVVFFVIFYLNNTNYIPKRREPIVSTSIKTSVHTTTKKLNYKSPITDMKYILLWTNPKKVPFNYFGEGNSIFKRRNCKFMNCYVTSNREYLGHYSEFEVVAFNGPQLLDLIGMNDIPTIRSLRQKYVFTNIEGASNYPICSKTWDKFFNWTWTYKLNSDAIWGYVLIKNASNHIVGPAIDMEWISEDAMAPIEDDVKSKLVNKNKAVAWFVSNCRTISGREQFFNEFQHYINSYNLDVDVYGDCGNFRCPKNVMNRCLDELQRHYYFYFAFENSICDDYVSEKILHALKHYTVPVVYGGANYSRFLPPGSYLDAIKLGPQLLARTIYEIIEIPERYYEFFRWRKYYNYHYRHETPTTDDYCNFCAIMNDEKLMNKSTVYNDFSAWWTPDTICASLTKPSIVHYLTI